MTNSVRYTASDDRGPSGKLWKGNAPLDGEWFVNPNKGWGVFDDFLTFGATANQYTILAADSTVLCRPLATAVGGVLQLTADNTQYNEVGIQYGLATSVIGKIDEGTGACAFEARWKISSIATAVPGVCIGLAEEAFIAANFMADSGTIIADKDFVGFQVKYGDPDTLIITHNTASGGGRSTLNSDVHTMVADTWVKTGFYFDGVNKVTFYVDGVVVDDVLTSATNFPDGEEMSFVFGLKTGTTTQFTADIDWWAFAQECV